MLEIKIKKSRDIANIENKFYISPSARCTAANDKVVFYRIDCIDGIGGIMEKTRLFEGGSHRDGSEN